MGRITSFSKQVIVFFLVTALIIRPTFAANFGGWTLGGGVAQGASTVYEGTKQVVIDGKNYIKKGTAKITPTASQVSKVLARGAAGYALSVAVEQLLGAVDWVLDPANNQIVYTKKSTACPSGIACEDPDKPNNDFEYRDHNGTLFDTMMAACASSLSYMPIGQGLISIQSAYAIDNNATKVPPYNGARIGCAFKTSAYPTGTDTAVGFVTVRTKPLESPEAEEKKIPLDAVAAQVISNAESDTDKKAAAQVATTAAAADIVAEAEKDDAKARPIAQQLESSAQTKPADQAAAEKANEAQGQSKPNTQNPEAMDLSLEFPVFCGWAPLVCEAAQVVISFPQTLTNWWETANSKAEEWATSISEAWTKVKEEYADKPEENTDTELDIPDQSAPDINTDISFDGSCPASRSVPVSFAGISTEIEFSFQWFCDVAAIAKPVIISISAFASALIVAGVRTEDD